jgi:hypothetical protein
MAVIHWDSFDNGVPSGSGYYVATGGRQASAAGQDGNCWDTYNSLGNGMARVATGTLSTIYVHFAFKLSWSGNYGDAIICRIQDGAGTDQCRLRMNNSTRTISLLRADGTVLATSTSAVSHSSWTFIALKLTVNNTTGAYDLRINGVSEASATGVDTQNTGNAQLTHVEIGTDNSMDSHYFDNYVLDDAQFLGTPRILNSLPDGAGNTTGMTASTGSNHTCVDESGAHNSDTDYVSSNVSGTKDTYAMADPTLPSGTIVGVGVTTWAKYNTTPCNMYNVVRSGGADYDGSLKTLASTYGPHRTFHATDPATSAAWTSSNVNAMEVGQKQA